MLIWLAGLLTLLAGARAGYMSLNMTTAIQCGRSLVRWTGDTGPYHLLLTPTVFREHGYNVWIESIPDGVNSYEVDIKLPAGLPFMVTVWGSSGISYAATSDVMTVQPSSTGNTTCFLSDSEILGLYSFSFNLTSDGGYYPPQCSHVNISWPTSLESNVTSDWVPQVSSSSIAPATTAAATGAKMIALDDHLDLSERDPSSSTHDGNTTHPPTMFGIIPLGNSFSIPITYSRSSRYAKYLPESSLSDDPTTYTRQGVTYLNWTVDMAKGTRFILVAGIGSQEKWASGGSSSMFTVGQGSTGCIGSEQGGGGAPSITGSSSAEVPTGPVGDSDPSDTQGGSGGSLTRTVVASVCSILGTLVIVGLLFMCRRARVRRRRPEITAFHSKPKAVDQMTVMSDTPLDLVQSHDESPGGAPNLTPLAMDGLHMTSSPPRSPNDPFGDQHVKTPFGPGPSRSTTVDSTLVSPVRASPMTRHPSHDALLPFVAYDRRSPPPTGQERGTGTWTGTLPGPGSGTYRSQHTSRGPLTLHDGGTFATDMAAENVQVPDLKRETVAFLGNQDGSAHRRQGPSNPQGHPGRRRRPQESDETEMEYIMHRDAGRVAPGERDQGRTVLELPPRYDEVDWEEEQRGEQGPSDRA
ncbi:hypothetical protein IAU60_005516 [Kwoniella sp. DSM 27419]